MKTKPFIQLSIVLLICLSMVCKTKPSVIAEDEIAVAFYNLDNLFDDIDDESKGDDEFTPNGKYAWTSQRYQQKLSNLAKIISEMVEGQKPDALGVCELESEKALKDLIGTGALKSNYQLVHHDSPDERGIDVGFIYNPKKLTVIEHKAILVQLSKDSNDRTRDILKVVCRTNTSDTLIFFVCHFPSRREGKNESEQNRVDAAKVLKQEVDWCGSKANVVILGDFNDQPNDNSMRKTLHAGKKDENPALINLMFELVENNQGSYFYKGHWEKLDQIIISSSLRDQNGMDYKEGSLSIKKEEWMIQKGKYEGYPLRTFGGTLWLNGYSDHLPVCMVLKTK